jgi:hypothetical protein
VKNGRRIDGGIISGHMAIDSAQYEQVTMGAITSTSSVIATAVQPEQPVITPQTSDEQAASLPRAMYRETRGYDTGLMANASGLKREFNDSSVWPVDTRSNRLVVVQLFACLLRTWLVHMVVDIDDDDDDDNNSRLTAIPIMVH